MQIRKVVAREDGAVLVFTVLVLVVLIGMAALAIDIGQMYIAKQRAQNVCDAAALAGGQLLTGDPSCIAKAEATAIENRDSNDLEVEAWQIIDFVPDASITTVEYDDGTTETCLEGEAIKVTGRVHVNFAFAGIFGLTGMDVPADATALLGPASRSRSPYLIPDGLPIQQGEGLEFDNEYPFGPVDRWQDAPPAPGAPGNWLTLDISGTGGGTGGMSEYEKRLAMDPRLDPVSLAVGDIIKTQAGGAGGESFNGATKTYDGLIGKNGQPGRILQETDPRFMASNLDAAGDGYDEYWWTGYNPDAWAKWKAAKDPTTGLYPPTNRIVIMPIIDLAGAAGSTDIEIKGFAAFFITRVWDGTTADADGSIPPRGNLEGYFIQAITSGGTDDDVWIFEGSGTIIHGSYRSVRLIS